MSQTCSDNANVISNAEQASLAAMQPLVMSADESEFIRRAASTFEGRAELADQAGVPMHELDSLLDASGRLLPAAFLDNNEGTLLKLCLVRRHPAGES